MAGHSDSEGDELNRLEIIAGGAVAACEGKIVAVGKSKEVEASVQLLPHARVFDAWGKLLCPALSSPIPTWFLGSRQEELELRLKGASYMEILEAGGGIINTVKRTLEASWGELVTMGRRRLDFFMREGVGTVEVKSGYALTTEGELRMLRVIKHLHETHPLDLVPTFLGAHAFPPEYQEDRDAFVDLIVEEMIPRVAKEKLAVFCDVFCEKGIFTLEQSERILEAGKIQFAS